MNPAQRWLRRAVSYVVHGGSWQLRAYELRILEAVANTLSSADSAALRKQLDSLEHLKRLHADRMVTFYFFDAEQLPKLTLMSPELCISRFRVKAVGAAGLHASVFTHLGLLSSLEFNTSPKQLLAAAQMELEPMPVKRGRSEAERIDRSEHG